MAASAQRIDFTGHSASNFGMGEGGPMGSYPPAASALTVNFRIYQRGPGHVAGLTYTTDFWVTTHEAIAKFLHFDGDYEVWQANATVKGHDATFEYVIFCNDNRDFQNVKKIYHTNWGNTFQIQATGSSLFVREVAESEATAEMPLEAEEIPAAAEPAEKVQKVGA